MKEEAFDELLVKFNKALNYIYNDTYIHYVGLSPFTSGGKEGIYAVLLIFDTKTNSYKTTCCTQDITKLIALENVVKLWLQELKNKEFIKTPVDILKESV